MPEATDDVEYVELLVHRVLARHGPGEVCDECPEWSVLMIAYGSAITDTRPQ